MNSINSTNFIGMLTVFCTWLYELITLMYLTSLVYYIYQRFRKLSLLGKLWIVVIFCLVLNVGTFLCILHGLSRIDRLYSFFSIAHDTNLSSPEGNMTNNNNSPSWVVVPLSFMVRHSDEEILAVIDESLHLSQSDLQRRRDPPSEDKLRQLERLWATITFVDHCRPDSNNIESNNIESNNIDSNNIESNNLDSNNIDSNNLESNNIDSNNIDSNNLDSNNLDANNIDSNNLDSNILDSNEEECMICLQPHSVTVVPIEGSTYLRCSCSCRFHKKCILEWFYFVEKRSQEEENVMMVTCPNCRHVFSRVVVVSTTSTSEEEGIST